MIHRKIFKREHLGKPDGLKEKVIDDINEWFNPNRYIIININDYDYRASCAENGPHYRGCVVFYMDKL